MIRHSYVHAISGGQILVDESLPVKVLYTFGSLQRHFDDFLRREGPRRTLAGQLAPQQKPLHVSVSGVRIQQERCASVLDGNTEDRKQRCVTEAVQDQAFS